MVDIFSLWHNAGNATKNSESKKKNLKNVNILLIINQQHKRYYQYML